MSYQWYKNDVVIPGATSATYNILQVGVADLGNYYVRVMNSGGTVQSSTVMISLAGPPQINTQPVSKNGVQVKSVTLTVQASGSNPLNYRWSFNGTPLAGATSSTLTLANLTTNSGGGYSAVVSNAYGSATSSVATLTVLVPPSITAQPQSLILTEGKQAVFSVTAAGTGPLSYQWYLKSSPLSGETNSVLTLTNVQGYQEGKYTAVVTNLAGSAISAWGKLTFLVPDDVVLSTRGWTESGFVVRVSAPNTITYAIEASDDMQNWTPIATNTAGVGSSLYTDTDASNHTSRFYRAVSQ